MKANEKKSAALPVPLRRTPPSLVQINSRFVQVIPGITNDFNSPGSTGVAFYRIEADAVEAIKEIAQRELLQDLIRRAENAGIRGTTIWEYLQHIQAKCEYEWENRG